MGNSLASSRRQSLIHPEEPLSRLEPLKFDSLATRISVSESASATPHFARTRRKSQSSSALHTHIIHVKESSVLTASSPALEGFAVKQDSLATLKGVDERNLVMNVPHGPNVQIHTAESVIEDMKSKHLVGRPDSTYGIEDFTAILAFGGVMNLEHPSLAQRHLSVADDSRADHSGSAKRDSILFTGDDVIDEVREKHLTLSPFTYSLEEIISFFGVGSPSSASIRNVTDSNEDPQGTSSQRSTLQVSVGTPDSDAVVSKLSAKSSLGSSDSEKSTHRFTIPHLYESEKLQIELPLFEHEIKQRMYPAIYRMGEYIIKKREIGNEMYFLSQGTVEVCSGDGKTVYSIINKGSFFGELGVLFNVPRTASVRAFDDCYCMILTRDNLEVVLRYFPNIATRFRQVAESRMAEVKRMIQYKQMLEYQQKMEAVKEE